MAKHISKQQTFKINSKMLNLERIDKFVDKVFMDLEEAMLAKTYIPHEQVV